MGDRAARSALRARHDVSGVRNQLEPVQRSLEAATWPLYAGPREVWRKVGDCQSGQREIFVLDPDGYLVMVAHDLGYRSALNEPEPVTIRPAEPRDLLNLRRAIVELQDYERGLHMIRLPGEQIADAYLAWLQQEAAENGVVLVAEGARLFIGFIAGWIVEEHSITETTDSRRTGDVSAICSPRPSDCSRPALRDRAAFRRSRHYARADRVVGSELVGAGRLSPGRLSAIRSHLQESYTNGLTLRATAIDALYALAGTGDLTGSTPVSMSRSSAGFSSFWTRRTNFEEEQQ
jgi:hypothetical protein